MQKIKSLLSVLLVVLLSACGGGGGSCSATWGGLAGGSCSKTTETPGAPIANGGGNQAVQVGTTVILDASLSSVQAGKTPIYRWSFNSMPAGSAAKFQINNAMQPSFLADMPGTYVITLTVNDGNIDSVPAIITVTASVANVAPTANAGVNQNVTTGSTVTLDGSATNDPNRDLLTYSWQMASRPAGSSAVLNKLSDVKPSFVADKNGAYVISLQANDGKATSELAYVTINASTANSAPVAVAGVNQYVVQGTTVTLDGTASSDVNRDLLTYSWSIAATPVGSNARLSNSTSAKSNLTPDLIGSYVVGLRVNDGTVDSEVSFVTITVSNINLVPVASAGKSQNVNMGDTVTLDASASADANNDLLSYSWAFVSRPASSAAKLSDVTSAKPSFLADQSGNYVLSLSVSDGKSVSPLAYTTVTASTINQAPTANAGALQSVITGSIVTLDGSSSSDPNRDLLYYGWSIVAKPPGSGASLVSPLTAKPVFTADQSGLYVVGLSVSDGALTSPIAYVSVMASAVNLAPVASAGISQNVNTLNTVTLDGTASSDANNDLLTYSWVFASKPSLSNAQLSGATSAKPTFFADQSGTYVLGLVVSDGKMSSPMVYTTVTASSTNLAPTANPGLQQNVLTGSSVMLDGTNSSDPNRDLLSFSWSIVAKPPGSLTNLTGANTPKPSFTADQSGLYIFSLVVSDSFLSSPVAYVSVNASVANVAPVAMATTSQQSVLTGTVVNLDGSASTDANNDPLFYNWVLVSRPNLSAATLTSTTSVRPAFLADQAGTYVFSLTVRDRALSSNTFILTVVAGNGNLPPTANAGNGLNTSLSAALGTSVNLDGSLSDDQNGDKLSYSWALVFKPLGSTATLLGSAGPKTIFVPDVVGVYVISLIVNDGRINSDPVYTTVTVR